MSCMMMSSVSADSCNFYYQRCLYPSTQCLPWQRADADVSFDLSSDTLAANTTDYILVKIEGNDWYANICGLTNHICKGSVAPAILVNSLAKDVCYVTGVDLVGSSLGLLDPTDAGRGLTMSFNHGDYRDCSKQRTTKFNIQCDPRPLPTRLINAETLTSQCDYILTFNSSNACPRIVIKPTPVPPTPDSGTSNGTLFCILLLVAAIVYVVGFSLYNYFVGKKRGLGEVLPHRQFWCYTLPGLVRDGVRYFLVLIKCSGAAAGVRAGGYENIGEGGHDSNPSATISSTGVGQGMAGAGQGNISYDGSARRGSASNISKTKNTELKIASSSRAAAPPPPTGTGFFGDGSFNAPSVRAEVPQSASTAVDVTASTAGAELYE